jgi:hypothetical protein
LLRLDRVGDSLQVMEQWWNDNDRGKAKLLAGELVTISLRLSQFSMDWPGISHNHHPYPKGDSFNSNKLFTLATNLGNLKEKLEVARNRPEGPEGGRRIALRFLTSVLEGVGGQHHGQAVLSPGKTRYPLHRRLGGPQGRSGRVRKISPHRDSIPEPSSA